MEHQIPLDPDGRAAHDAHDGTQEVSVDLAYKRLAIVNVIYYGRPGDPNWVLVDAGLMQTAGAIRSAAAERFGEGNPPSAIVMTHGHFDHVGALEELAEAWNVPVYAHPLEHPFLNGTTSYPPPDPSVGGGLVARMSGLFPRSPVDVSRFLRPLPEDGSVPFMPGWQWVFTPGHTPGHVSLWRESDRTIVAGDAFITTTQESLYAVTVQKPAMHGPPMYFTPDWAGAAESVRKLAALEPEIVVTGHGQAMRGADMRQALHTLADDFERIAIPEQGRYVL